MAAHTEPERSRTNKLTSDSGKCATSSPAIKKTKTKTERKGGEEKDDEMRRRRRKRFNTAGASWRSRLMDGWMDGCELQVSLSPLLKRGRGSEREGGRERGDGERGCERREKEDDERARGRERRERG